MTNSSGAGRLPVSAVEVSGAGAVGLAVNSTVITGDGNVVLQVDGRAAAQVPIPDSVAEVERLLFDVVAGPSSTLVGSWLRPDAGVIDPEPRPEADVLVDWCSAGRGPVVRLVIGVGGQGKTHLADQVCGRLRGQGWLAGSVRLPSPNWRAVRLADLAEGGAMSQRARRELQRVPELTAAVHAAAHLGVRMLLVVDYAENVGPVVAELLDTIGDADAAKWVRVLLLARTDADWFRELAVDHPLHDWVHPTPMRLTSLTQGWNGSRTEVVWTRSVERFTERARQHDYLVPAGTVPVMPASGFATTLDLYAKAMVAVLDAANGPGPGDPADRDAMAGVLRHEHRQAAGALLAAGLQLDELQQAWALAGVTLTAPTTHTEAVEVVGRIPLLAELDQRQRRRLVEVLCRLYPDGSRERVWQAPKPDRLADTHLLELAGRAPSRKQWVDELTAVCGRDDAEAAGHATMVLHRCLSTPDPDGFRRNALAMVRDGLAGLAKRFPVGYVPALVVVDPVGFEPEIIDAVTGNSGSGVELALSQVEELDALLNRMGFATTRTRVAVAVSQRLVTATRPGPREDFERLSRYARALNNLSVRLGELGRRDEGLAAIEEATAVYRRLAEANPAAHLPNLATCLNNLSARLGELGRRDVGLATSEEAVRIRRQLADANPAAYLVELATSLNNLSNRLGELGRGDEGLAAIEEATAVYRRLAKANPAAHLPEFATLLNNLSVRLREVGRRDEGLAAIEEAVGIRRRLAEANPAAYLLNLAASLNNLSALLGELGRHDDGLAASEEAVEIRRRLAEANPAAYLPHLAASLNNLSLQLGGLGRHDEGLAASEESVGIRRRLAEANPAAYLPDLATSLNSLSVLLGGLARHEKGLAASEEAVEIRRQLTETNPAANLPELAASLNNLSIALGELGRHEESLAASEEAVEIRRQLAETNPAANLHSLAAALNNLSANLGEVGRLNEGLAASEEAVEIRRRLAETKPAANLPELAAALNNRSVLLGELGRHDEGLAASEEAVEIRRRLAETNPAANLPKLAASLKNLSNVLNQLGRTDEANAAIREADQLG